MKFLIKFILILVFLFLSFQKAFAEEIKFIQISDSHLSINSSAPTQREVGGSKDSLEKAIKDINSIKNVDFIIFTGDNIDTANSDDLKQFLKMANKLKAPYYVVIGNHEVFKSQDLTKKDYMKIVRRYSKNCRPKGANYVFKKKGIIFLVVDGAKEVIPGPSGYYKKDTLKWLDKKLTKYKNIKVVIFQHFPLIEPYHHRTHKTYNAEAYEKVLEKHNNVIGIFSGHYHANNEFKKDGVYRINSPALVEPPHNYKIVEIKYNKTNNKDIQVYTMLRHAQ